MTKNSTATSTTPAKPAGATKAKKPVPTFRFTVDGLCEAEVALGKKVSDIVAEATSATGLSLHSLRALVAAGLPRTAAPARLWYNLDGASAIIATHGIGAVATAIAEPLRRALEEMA